MNHLVTTPGHEIALPVVFESGLLHFAGGPEEYRKLPAAPKEFFQRIPVVWDETRFLQGDPGKFAVIVRRAGELWYVGGINGGEIRHRGKPTPRSSTPVLMRIRSGPAIAESPRSTRRTHGTIEP